MKRDLLPLQALLLAAGYGTRLKEVGQKTAKGLFKNQQQLSITDLTLQQLQQLPQIKQVALVTNNRFACQYREHLDQAHPNHDIQILNDGSNQPKNRLGSLGDLVFALKQLEWWQDNVLVLPSDRTPEHIIPNLIQLFQQHPKAFITCVSKDSKQKIKNKSGCAQLNSQQQIISFEEKPAKPKSNYRALPFYIFPPQALELLQQYQKAGNNMDAPGNIIPWLISCDFPVYAYTTKKISFDIGSLEELALFKQQYRSPEAK